MLQQQLTELRSKQHIQSIQQLSSNVHTVCYSPTLTNSPYSHLTYNIKLYIPEKYPQLPPSLHFMDHIYHLNIHPTTGQVHMPILDQDWSPYLTLAAVFDSLDNILQEPDPNFPATNDLQQQYLVSPQTYASKLTRVISGKLNISNQAQEEVGLARSHSRQKLLQNGIEARPGSGKSSPKNGNKLKVQRTNDNQKQTKLQGIEGMFLDAPTVQPVSFQDIQNTKINKKVQKNQPKTVPNDSKAASKGPLRTSLVSGQSSDKKLRPSQNLMGDIQDKKFLQISANLQKAQAFLQVLMVGYDSMESTLNTVQNTKIREMVTSRMEKQWKMVGDVMDLSGKLKEKLFRALQEDTKHLLH